MTDNELRRLLAKWKPLLHTWTGYAEVHWAYGLLSRVAGGENHDNAYWRAAVALAEETLKNKE